jgi:hypothetical protein
MNSFTHRLMAGVTFLLVVSLVSGCVTMTPIRQHPDFANAARQVQTVAILPPDVEYLRIVFTGDNERQTDKEQTITQELQEGLETALKKKQYALQPWLSDKQKEANKNASFDLQQVRTAYNEAAKQLFEKPANEEESKNYRVSLGPVVNPVASLVNAEALLYVRYNGFEKSGGQQTKDIVAGVLLGALTGVIPVYAGEGSVLEVALIDGATGDVLWANRGGNQGPGGLGFQAPLMAENILTRLPGKEIAVAASDGNTAKAADSAAPATAAK